MHQVFKVRKFNHAAIRNSCAYIFFLLFSNQVVRMGKVFVSDGSYVTLYDFLSAGFLLDDYNRTQTHNHLTLNH